MCIRLTFGCRLCILGVAVGDDGQRYLVSVKQIRIGGYERADLLKKGTGLCFVQKTGDILIRSVSERLS